MLEVSLKKMWSLFVLVGILLVLSLSGCKEELKKNQNETTTENWHIECYSGGIKIHEGWSKSEPLWDTQIDYTDKATKERVVVTNNCVIRKKQFPSVDKTPDPDR